MERLSAAYSQVNELFQRALAVLYLAVFVSLAHQFLLLAGSNGLEPYAELREHLFRRYGYAGFWEHPTLFYFAPGDGAMRAGTALGLSCAILYGLGIQSRLCLALCGLLFLSCANAGTTFFSFQWDNLLLETTLLALFLPAIDPVWRAPPARPSLHPAVRWLFRWLLFRLYFESGLAKWLAGGEGGWRDWTAMRYYYDTAPVPTWFGWLAHQLPPWAHDATSALTLLLEIGVPLLIFGPRAARWTAFAALNALQVAIILTANYAQFNYLSILLSLFLLDDAMLGVLRRLPARILRRGAAPENVPIQWAEAPRMPTPARVRFAAMWAVAAVLILASLLEFQRYVAAYTGNALPERLERVAAGARAWYGPWRVVNAYHLFANMTRDRIVVEIQGRRRDDPQGWRPYRFRYLPGELTEITGLVAPFHPRVDFRLWFLVPSRLPPEPRDRFFVACVQRATWFQRLLLGLLSDPPRYGVLFRDNPFPDTPPDELRLDYYSYRMTDLSTWWATGQYWRRVHVGAHPVTFFLPQSPR